MSRLPLFYALNKQRNLKLFLESLLACLLVAGLIITPIRIRQNRSPKLTYTVGKDTLSNQLAPTAISIHTAPKNILYNGNFNLPQLHATYRPLATEAKRIDAIADPESLPPQFFKGGQLEIVSDKSTGKDSICRQIDDIKQNVFTKNLAITWPVNLAQPLSWQAFAQDGDILYVAGSKRQIVVLDRESSTLFLSPSKEDIVNLCPWGTGLLLLDSAGKIFHTSDFVTWQEFTISGLPKITHLATLNFDSQPIFLAVGEQGTIVRGVLHNSEITHQVLNAPTPAELRRVVVADGIFYVIGSDNALWQVDELGRIKVLTTGFSGEKWNLLDSNQHTLLAVSQSGRAIVRQGNQPFSELNLEQLYSISPQTTTQEQQGKFTLKFRANLVSCAVISDRQWLLQDDRGNLFYTEDAGKNWQLFTEHKSFVDTQEGSALDLKTAQLKRLNRNSVLLIDDQGQAVTIRSGISIILAEKLDSTLEESDRLLLTSPAQRPAENLSSEGELRNLGESSFVVGEWYLTSDLEGKFMIDENEENDFSLYLSPSESEKATLRGLYTDHQLPPTGVRAIRQYFSKSQLEQLRHNSVFQLQFRARATDDAAKIKLDFINFAEVAPSIEKEITNTDRDYSFNIVLPSTAVQPVDNNRQAALQLSILSGGLIIDDFRLWPVVSELETIVSSPSLMRFEDVIYPGYAWLSPTSQMSFVWQKNLSLAPDFALEDQLKPYVNREVTPWLRIDTLISEQELADLVTYLSGSSKLAIGTSFTYASTVDYFKNFPQIILEFTDSTGSLQDDNQRRKCINRLTDAVRRTAAYQQHRQQIILVDGMAYTDNSIKTNVDYPLLVADDQVKDLSTAEGTYLLPQTWRHRQTQNNDFRPAIMARNPSRADFLSEISLALGLRGEYTYSEILPAEFAQAAAVCLGDLAGTHRLRTTANLNRRYIETERNVSDSMPHFECFAFASNEQRVFYLLNHEQESLAAGLEDCDLSGYRLRIFDSTGNIISDRTLKQNPDAIEVPSDSIVCLSGRVQ